MGRRKRSAADDDSSSSSSSEERRRRKKHKREKHKKDKKERKRTKHHESVDAKASRSKELPTKAFLAFIRKGERDAVVEALEDHPDLMLIRVPAAGRETWSVVHEAVAMCPVTGNGAASGLARYVENAALEVLAAILRRCGELELNANSLLSASATHGENTADVSDAVPRDDGTGDDAVPEDSTEGSGAPSHAPSALPRLGSIVQAVYSRRWQPATVVGHADLAARIIEVTFFGYHDVIRLTPDRWSDASRPTNQSEGGGVESADGAGAGDGVGGSSSGVADVPSAPRSDAAGESPLHLAAWQGSRPAVEMLLIAGADLLRAAPSGLLPVHCACDRRAPAYPRNGADGTFVPWLLEKMRERDADVEARLRTEVPAAFWRRGCDPQPLGIEAPPPDADPRRLAAGYAQDDPLFD